MKVIETLQSKGNMIKAFMEMEALLLKKIKQHRDTIEELNPPPEEADMELAVEILNRLLQSVEGDRNRFGKLRGI
ncbi:hypothetical protein [Isachenkonia alkalipeptolytica]|uniref:Uncharacterized protein n=1 Tax=Isachenkonia alkalipeptolytica TaxID=2565777 RepID=A0AA43XMQ7_9CLOT|nr:hypothetical protein [Isachenkonia alkalipeptolytica]NBG89296.1 hypothetical protein [Isachenkonia alkalipeptolytica]